MTRSPTRDVTPADIAIECAAIRAGWTKNRWSRQPKAAQIESPQSQDPGNHAGFNSMGMGKRRRAKASHFGTA